MRCTDGHRFDSWFASGSDFDRLRAAGHLACAICGGAGIEKDLMAPAVATTESRAAPEETPLSAPASPAEQALAELRRRIEATTEDVGRNFAAEARRIHAGEATARPILGEARLSDARALVEDGIPIAPLPWSSRKGN